MNQQPIPTMSETNDQTPQGEQPRYELPIGVFDSGVGGLTVLAALAQRLPQEHLLYLGDTARLPYGTKSVETVTRYALQATAKLVERKVKMLVVACNTATAAALPALRAAYPHIPVLGVVEPGAAAAVAASTTGNILVLATEATVQNRAYHKAIAALRPSAEVTGLACSLFVALVEEGWAANHVVDAHSGRAMAEVVAARYLEPLFAGAGQKPDCIVLGCTHFPPLAEAIRKVVGPGVAIVDSAATTAEAAAAVLAEAGIARRGAAGRHVFLTTDAPARFARVGSMFMAEAIDAAALELVVL